MNITLYLFNCHPTQIFFWRINQGGRLVHDSLTWCSVQGRQEWTGGDRTSGCCRSSSLKQPGGDRSFLWDWQYVSCSVFYWRIWSSKTQCFWSRSHCYHGPPYPSGLSVHPPAAAPALFPLQASSFLPSLAARCSQANGDCKLVGLGNAAAWALLQSCFSTGFGLCELGDLPIERREASCSFQKITELAEHHRRTCKIVWMWEWELSGNVCLCYLNICLQTGEIWCLLIVKCSAMSNENLMRPTFWLSVNESGAALPARQPSPPCPPVLLAAKWGWWCVATLHHPAETQWWAALTHLWHLYCFRLMLFSQSAFSTSLKLLTAFCVCLANNCS